MISDIQFLFVIQFIKGYLFSIKQYDCTILNNIYIRIVMEQLTSIISVQHAKIGLSLILAALSYIKIAEIKDQRTNIKNQSEISIKNKNQLECQFKPMKEDKLSRNEGGNKNNNKEQHFANSKMEEEDDRNNCTPFQYSNKDRIYQGGENKSNMADEEKDQLIDFGSFIKRKYKQKMQSIKNPIFPILGQKIKNTQETEQIIYEQNRDFSMYSKNKSAQQEQRIQQEILRFFGSNASNPIQQNKNIMYCETPKYQRTINPHQNRNNASINEEQTIKNNNVRQIVIDNQFPNLNLSLGQSSNSEQSQSKKKRISKLKSKGHKLTKNANTDSHKAFHRNNRIGQHRKIACSQRPPTAKILNKKNPNIQRTYLFQN